MKRRSLDVNANGAMVVKSVTIDGIPPSICHRFTTSIDFDMDLHRNELFKLPIGHKDLYFSIEYAINQGKKVAEADVGE